jgi:hypothetical protein
MTTVACKGIAKIAHLRTDPNDGQTKMGDSDIFLSKEGGRWEESFLSIFWEGGGVTNCAKLTTEEVLQTQHESRR